METSQLPEGRLSVNQAVIALSLLLIIALALYMVVIPDHSIPPKLLRSTPHAFVVESVQAGKFARIHVKDTITGFAYEARYCEAMEPGMKVTLDEEVWEYPGGSKSLSVGGVEKACLALTPPRYPSS
jgi:hypothetical protein